MIWSHTSHSAIDAPCGGSLVGLEIHGEPFPDWDGFNGDAVFYYLPFSIPSNDDTLILLIGFQEFDESTHFAFISIKVINAVRYLNGFIRLR